MAWRIVKQPNGLLARFSDIVDDFTDYDMTEDEAFEVCHHDLGVEESKRKVRAGIEDWPPWKIDIKGTGHDRWDESIKTIRSIHGDNIAAQRIEELSGGPPS
jgi:hypothetical protein